MTDDSLRAIRGARIAQLIEVDEPGGAERMVADLATELARGGSPEVVFLPRNGEGWLATQIDSRDVTVEYFQLDRPFSPRFARKLADRFVSQRISLAHSHEFGMAVYGAWAARRAGIPHVITMHGSRYYAGRLQRRLAMRLAIASSSAVVAVSHALAEHLSRDLLMPRDRVSFIANGVRRSPISSSTLRSELGLSTGSQLLLSVGSLFPVKGHCYLIDAVAALAELHSNVHVALAGTGHMAQKLSEQARELGIAERVHMLGLRSDVPNLLAGADVFVLPSLSEGLPLALLEAMFAGRPIVATDVGEVRSVLGGDAGLLVPPGDGQALAAAISQFLLDPDAGRDCGRRAASRAAGAYSLERMVERYASIYSKLLASRCS
ncbi:MAG TPA: glycosyltransferase family 4 protein [Gemmatimonadaceae bacterium]|nr:glycosyltransferase family 4 protein [Gemmatimonadaceae bacterium]